ncbi:hypothetical protein D3C80_585860 [compost metagenome]
MTRLGLRRGAALGVVAAVWSVAAAGAANADCRLTITAPQDYWVIRHDPYTQEIALGEFDLMLTNEGDANCVGQIQTETLGEAFGMVRSEDVSRIPYALVDERNGTDVTPRAGASARRASARPVSLAPGDREMLRFSLVVSPEAALGDGDYTQNLVFAVNTPDGMPLAERLVTVGISVPAAALMGLKGAVQRTGAGATIDLGELTEGRRALGASLYVLSTRGYAIGVSSDNQGKLRLAATDWSIPYGLALGSEEVNLVQGDEVRVASRRPRVDDYPLSIQIGDTSNRRAGEYTDTLRFTISPF